MKRFSNLLVAAFFVAAGAQAQTTKPGKPAYKRDVPAALAKKAKVSEADAVAAAQKLVPNGTISSLELEREDGYLRWSFDFKVPGKTGIDEVGIDALTGKQIGGIEHESPASEKKEAAAEKKEATKKKPSPSLI